MAIKHTIRSKDGGTINVTLTAIRAIRLQCIECMGHQPLLVPGCTDPHCSLFPYRMGKNTSITRPDLVGKRPTTRQKVA
jgi:hypothetical protein